MLACRDNTYFYNQDSYGLLPDDFKIEVGYEGNPFKELFMKLETILAASFIASNATIQSGQMKLQIMGQRSVDYVCRLNEIMGNQVLYKIYDWIYSGGSSIDKAIIARNIIPYMLQQSKSLLSPLPTLKCPEGCIIIHTDLEIPFSIICLIRLYDIT